MTVIDASTLVSATFKADGIPFQAVRHAFEDDKVAISDPVMTELLEVLYRPALQRFVRPSLRDRLLAQFAGEAVPFDPHQRVADCRDPKDDKYLELALAASATSLVSSDQDLLILHPWRGIPILTPAAYLTTDD